MVWVVGRSCDMCAPDRVLGVVSGGVASGGPASWDKCAPGLVGCVVWGVCPGLGVKKSQGGAVSGWCPACGLLAVGVVRSGGVGRGAVV